MVRVDLDDLRRGLSDLPPIQAEQIGWALDELEQLRARVDLASAQILMVASELSEDPKINPKDTRDPRWTPALAAANDLRWKLVQERATSETLRAAVRAVYDLERATSETLRAAARAVYDLIPDNLKWGSPFGSEALAAALRALGKELER